MIGIVYEIKFSKEKTFIFSFYSGKQSLLTQSPQNPFLEQRPVIQSSSSVILSTCTQFASSRTGVRNREYLECLDEGQRTERPRPSSASASRQVTWSLGHDPVTLAFNQMPVKSFSLAIPMTASHSSGPSRISQRVEFNSLHLSLASVKL